jgi:hypothetical protein
MQLFRRDKHLKKPKLPYYRELEFQYMETVASNGKSNQMLA